MKLTNKSKQLMAYFKNNLNYVEQTKRTDSILLELYRDIYDSYAYMKANCSYTTSMKSVGQAQVIMPTTFNKNSFPSEVIRHIFNKSSTELTYEFTVFKRRIKVIFITEEKQNGVDVKEYDKYVNIIYMWLFIMNKYAPVECSSSLIVYFYLTSLEKKLPDSNNHIIGDTNANTAFTRSCQSSAEIVIFRKEDWLKVFFHECGHSYGLDFSDMNTDMCAQHILNIFQVKSDVNLFEAYSEFWAEIMNALFYSFFALKNKADENEFLDNAEIMINYERTYSFFQLVKVLDFMGLTYKDLYSKSEQLRKALYKENTNILSYYIIKTVLINNYQMFLYWCLKHNTTSLLVFQKTLANQREFCKFIEKTYKTRDMLAGVNAAEQFMKSKQNNARANNYLLTNMKMSIIEMG